MNMTMIRMILIAHSHLKVVGNALDMPWQHEESFQIARAFLRQQDLFDPDTFPKH